MPPVDSARATVSVRSFAAQGARGEHRIRDLPPLFSDPGQAHPSPLELLLAALNGCESILLSIVAREKNIAYDTVDMVSEGEIDYRGMMGDPSFRPYFQSVRQTVRIRTTASDEAVAQLREEVERRCPVFTLLRAAGVLVHADWARADS